MYENNSSKVLPVIGAVIGSIPGMLIWALLGSFGFTWALIGLVIVAGAFIGYGMLGGDTSSTQGFITCIIVVLIAVYCGAHLAWSMQLHSALKKYDYDISLSDCILHLHTFLGIMELKGKFIGSLLTDYLLAGLGVFGFFRRAAGR